MTEPIFRGARGSNAGDDFHELWALRQALALLDQDTALTAVTVEGLLAEDEEGKPLDTWDGVDCALYYGSDPAAKADRIAIAQLKYSAANRDQAWTVARLTQTSNKKKNNSVIGRLANAFAGLKDKQPTLATTENLRVRFVSNQSIDPIIGNALSDITAPEHAALLAASRLTEQDFETFTRALDFSECGLGSRFALEERVLATISEWTDDDARAAVNDLMSFVRRKMMPEATGEFITRQSILLCFGFSDPGALFPCPSAIKQVDRLISREASRNVADRMKSGKQRICLHGDGGSGKTTALQEIACLLPPDSVVIVFDCYENGRYLDSDAYRHRAPDAFLQVSNDIARQLRIPLLLSRKEGLDYPRVFKKRLERATEVVVSRQKVALLVVIVDAADNSVIAASSRAEKSFVHEFVRLGDLPPNVRLVVTTRTGRLPTLNLPGDFDSIEIKGFDRIETASHVRGVWSAVPDTWIDDFHHLSGGNPRVQQYALDYAKSDPARALDYLRPNGKSLAQVFREQLDYALRKQGGDKEIKLFCAGLVALPRPVPLTDLSVVTGISVAQLRDLCADLAPGVRLTDDSIGFADEDFEHFVQQEAESSLGPLRANIAEYFLRRRTLDAYAATHVATALLAAGRGREIIDLVKADHELKVIGDPVLRREVQLERLRLAMKVCRESGNNVDAMLTLLIGAEALKTDAAIHNTLVENPDLAANFARDTSSRIVLRDPEQIKNHGPLLFHLMAADARDGDSISVREGHRQVRAWLQRRTEDHEERKKKHPRSEPGSWSIGDDDIAAETEAVLRVEGPRRAVDRLMQWRPKSVALRVATILASKLIASGEASLVERCLAEASIQAPWDLFLLTPLALAGKKIDISRLEISVPRLLRSSVIRLDQLANSWRNEDAICDYLDTILTACEVIVARGGDGARITPVLERFVEREFRRRDKLFTSQVSVIDFTLRAHALLERMAGSRPTLETYWVDPPEPPKDLPPERVEQLNKSDHEKKDELQAFIGPLVDLYDIRAQALLGSITPEDVVEKVRTKIAVFNEREYRYSLKHDAQPMRTRVGLSITRLMAMPSVDRIAILECSSGIIGPHPDLYGSAEAQVFASLALDHSLHNKILSAVTARAKAVRSMKTSADDKLVALIRAARLLVPISYKDAESLFNEAIEVAGELNSEAVHEIALFAPLAERAVARMHADERRVVARSLAIVIADAGVRLAGYDHFPWEESARALATLDIGIALAATARWEDSNIVDRASFLPSILEAALSRHELSPVQVSGLSPLLDEFSVDLIGRIVDEAIRQKNDFDPKALAEELAQEELLWFGQGIRQQVCEKLKLLPIKDGPGFWMDRLARATTFHQVVRPSRAPFTSEREKARHYQWDIKRSDPLACIDWTAHRFVSTPEIDEVIARAFAAARMADTFVSMSDIFDRMRSLIPLSDRVAHLEALSRSESSEATDYERVQTIAKGVAEWSEAPSVSQWCRERLMEVIVDLLPGFSYWIGNRQSPLPALLEKSGALDNKICAALIEGMERHVDSLPVRTIYAFVGLAGSYCLPNEAAQVIARYADRLLRRIPTHEQDEWNLADIPTEPAAGIARLLYAFMGDVDVWIRWRAAHALRRLVRLGDTSTLDNLVRLYDITNESSYRKPDAPFYWLAARLWLVMALDRITDETPLAVGRHGPRLLEIARDDKFPHILIRSFAKSAVCKLVERRALALNRSQRDALKRVNRSPVRRKTGRKSYTVGFDRYKYRQSEDRRFHFDTMDTLPYWYSRAVRRFADLDVEEFLDAAERWIVDRWEVQGETWRWDQEPRQLRFSDRSVSSMHSHGSLPILERFHTYLEWHAMWCATGELMQRHPLVKGEEDDYDTFEHWLRGEGLTAPPLWFADLHGPKPLEDQLWFAPKTDFDVWIEDISDDDFLAELGLNSRDGSIVVDAYYDTQSRGFQLSVRVHTALVSPDTAGALVRALQTIEDSWDYRIPTADDELELNVPRYKLVGWLIDDRHDLGIDERDPFRYGVRAIESRPSNKIATALNIEFVYDDQARWVERSRRRTVFVYEAWGDTGGDEAEDSFRHSDYVRSSGWRLRADKETLRILLNKMNLDLIVEIEITRKNKGYEYSRDDEKKTKEARFDRVVRLRRDGAIEAAEGRLGTWTAPRP